MALFGWYQELSWIERRTFWACYGGWSLDALDAQMFGLAIPAIVGTWGIGNALAGSLGSASLAASAVGGWAGGALTDRYGRVRMLQATILCFSVFTFLSAFACNPVQLLVLKALQGLGFGAEWAVGSVLIAETIRPAHRGKAMGTVQSGWAVGWGLAVVFYGLAFSVLPPAYAWRFLFGAGLLPALLVIFIQRSLTGTATSVSNPQARPGLPLLGIFSRRTLRVTLTGAMLGVGAHGGYYALATWLPAYLRTERKLSVLGTGGYLAVIIAGFWCGCITCAYLLDLVGRRRTILLFSVCCCATVAGYLLMRVSDAQMLLLGGPLGFFSAGIPASMGPLFSEIYPSGIRGTGVGFCYNFGRIVSAGFPALVGKLSTTMTLGWAIGVDAVFAYSLVVVSALLLPETSRSELKS